MKATWLILILAVCLVVTVAALAYAVGKTSAPEVIRAQRFELVDAEGKIRAVLSSDPDGRPGPDLVLFDYKDEIRAKLALDGLELRDGKGHVRAAFVLRDSPALMFVDEGGVPGAWLSVRNDGTTALELSDERARTRAVLGTTDLVTTRTGAETKTAVSSLVLFDKDGKVLWKTP